MTTLVRDVVSIRRAAAAAAAAAATPSSGPRTLGGGGRLLEPTTCAWGDDDYDYDESGQESDEGRNRCRAINTSAAAASTRVLHSSTSSPFAPTTTAAAALIHVHENDDDALPPPHVPSRRTVVVVGVKSRPGVGQPPRDDDDDDEGEDDTHHCWGRCRRPRRRRRPVWTREVPDELVLSALTTTTPLPDHGADNVDFALECVHWTMLPATAMSLLAPSPSSTVPSLTCLVELHLVQCDLHSLHAIQAVPNLEALRIVDCHVTNVSAQEWTTCLTHLTCLTALRLEALDVSNSSLHSIAVGVRHVSDTVSIGPLYNDRQFFPALRTVVQNCQAQSLELFGGGIKDSNLIHIVNGLLPTKQRRPKQQLPDASAGVCSSIRSLTIQNYAGGSKATLTKLFRAVHHRSSRKEAGLRHFALSLAHNDADMDGSTLTSRLVDLLPLVALIQSDTYLETLSIEPPLVVDRSWKVPLLRAMQLNTHLHQVEGFVSDHDSSAWKDRLQQYVQLNRCGRAAIRTATNCPALWPDLLHHVGIRNQYSGDPNAMLYFVREYCVGVSEAAAAQLLRENA